MLDELIPKYLHFLATGCFNLRSEVRGDCFPYTTFSCGGTSHNNYLNLCLPCSMWVVLSASVDYRVCKKGRCLSASWTCHSSSNLQNPICTNGSQSSEQRWENILYFSTEYPEALSISGRLGEDTQEGDFIVHCNSSNYFKNFNTDFITYHDSPLELNHPFALLGVNSRCFCSLKVYKCVLVPAWSILLYRILHPKGLSTTVIGEHIPVKGSIAKAFNRTKQLT